MRTLLCGDQDPVFTREEILKYTEPKLGYTKESPGFLKFVNVLVELTGAERKAFLQVFQYFAGKITVFSKVLQLIQNFLKLFKVTKNS